MDGCSCIVQERRIDMGGSIKTLLQAVRADDISVKGEIKEAYRSSSTIVIAPEDGGDDVIIIGFPFCYLEAQLDDILDHQYLDEVIIRIDKGDCVKVDYSEEELVSGQIVNKWESLTMYCEAAECCEAEEECQDEECCRDVKCKEDCYCDAEGLTHDSRLTNNNRKSGR
jgi:hypothetical protein